MSGASGSPYLQTAGQREVKQWLGAYYGAVSNNNDPTGKHRVTMKVPQVLGLAVTTWAVPLTPVLVPPAVGSLVIAFFIGGDPDQPAYLVQSPAQAQPLLLDTNSADIQPLGVRAAGASGLAADAVHTHPTTGLTNSGYTAAIAETMPIYAATGSVQAPSGTLQLAAINLAKGTVVSNITFLRSSATGASTTRWWFSLLDNAYMLRAVTAGQTTAPAAGNTVTLPLAAAYTATYTGQYYVGVMCSGSSSPGWAGSAINPPTNIIPGIGGINGTDTGLSTPGTPGVTQYHAPTTPAWAIYANVT